MALFTGLIKCAKCGRVYKSKNERGKIKYLCSTYDKYGKEHCERFSLSEEKMITYVQLHYPSKNISVSDIPKLIKSAEVCSSKIIIKYSDNTQSEIGYNYAKY